LVRVLNLSTNGKNKNQKAKMMLMQSLADSVRSQFEKLKDPEQRPFVVNVIRTTIQGAANTLSRMNANDQANGRAILDSIVSELAEKYDVHTSYQIAARPAPVTSSSRTSTAALNTILVSQARADIAKLKDMSLTDPSRALASERVRMVLKQLQSNGVDTTELEGEFRDSFPRNNTIEQVNSFFRKFGQTFSSDATQPQAEIPLDRIQDMLRRLEPSIAEIAATSAKSALKKSSEALDAIVPSEPVRDVVRATRYTSFQIAQSTRSEVVRLFMLLVNMFLTFKVAVVAAVYVFLMTTPVLAPTAPASAPAAAVVFDARAQASLLSLASDEASHSVNKVLDVLEHGPWGQSDAVVLEYGRTKLCGVLSKEAAITREEELLVNPSGGAFMLELQNVCNDQHIWATEAAAADFFRESMIGAGCVEYNPFKSLLELSGECPVPENSFVRAAVATTNQLKQTEEGLLMWVGASVLSITLILGGVGSGVSFGKKVSKKWSLKYKRSINCRKPKGFSQKQYCTYGRRRR
jgi:hypothetical protein